MPPSDDSAVASPPRSQRRRWWWAAAAVVVVIAVVAGVALWLRRGSEDTTAAALDLVGTPKDLLVSFPLDRQPVPGWRLTPADIGLPPGFSVGSMFASSGNRAYFATNNCYGECLDPMSFVYGIDTVTGQSLFPPVALTGFDGGVDAINCSGNGPGVAVCVSGVFYDERPPLAWVLDLDRGAVTFSGPHGLYATQPSDSDALARLDPVGDHLGETWLTLDVSDKGAYGIGAQAEPTWFVPSSGGLETPNYLHIDNIPPLTLGVAGPNPADPATPQTYRVVSVIDGADLTPTPPEGVTLDQAAVYNGGFAYQYDGPGSSGVLFYDTDGEQVGRVEGGRMYLMRSSAMPIILNGSQWQIYTAAGRFVAEIPGDQISTDFKTIGTNLYVKQPATPDIDTSWQQWDLLTGNPGPTCNFDLGMGYVASDGTTILSTDYVADTPAASPSDPPHAIKTMAVDWSSCDILWASANRSTIWQVGTGLIERNLDGDLLTSLVPAP